MALDKRNYRQLVDTTVEIAQKVTQRALGHHATPRTHHLSCPTQDRAPIFFTPEAYEALRWKLLSISNVNEYCVWDPS